MSIHPSSLGPSKHYMYKIHEINISSKIKFIHEVCTRKYDKRNDPDPAYGRFKPFYLPFNQIN